MNKVINISNYQHHSQKKSEMKNEMKREPSPHTPYKRKAKQKAKGKEINPGANCTGLNARAYARPFLGTDPALPNKIKGPRGSVPRKAHLQAAIAAAVDDAIKAFHGTSEGPYCDARLWANFARRFGYDRLLDLVDQGKAEMREHRHPVPNCEQPAILQNLINQWWFSKGQK